MSGNSESIAELKLSRRSTAYGDVERWGTAMMAASLLAFGLSRRSVPGVLVAAGAIPLAYRSLARQPPRYLRSRRRYSRGDTRAALAGERGIHVRESVRLEKPLAEVYRFWRRFENLPRFMTHLEQVIDLGNGRSHWIARGPAGMRVEWDAEIINEVENRVIGWRSLPGADVVMAGSVTFAAARQGRSTQVSVHLQYAPPAGRLGSAVATVVGREPSQTIREDLRRFKRILEAGEVPKASLSQPRAQS
jgi:uncharacterized membrane protein